jgi:hypothetical protein
MVLATLQVDLGDVFLKSAVPLLGKSAISLRLSASAPIDAAVALVRTGLTTGRHSTAEARTRVIPPESCLSRTMPQL